MLLASIPTAWSLAADNNADPAVQQIRKFYDALLAAMKNGAALGTEGRYRELKPVVEQTFDLPTMTELSVGPDWATLSPQDQKALITAFERMTVASYAKNFSSYNGEKFEVEPTAQERANDKLVQSKFFDSDQKIVLFNYRMRQTDGTWKIIDVFLNGYVSQLAMRRSDFAATVKASGADGLVKKINDLADKLMKS